MKTCFPAEPDEDDNIVEDQSLSELIDTLIKIREQNLKIEAKLLRLQIRK